MRSTSMLPLTLHQRDNPSIRASANASIRFQGQLSVTALGRAVAFIMRRHEALRIRFIRYNEQLQQCFVDPIDSYDLPITCITDLAAAEERIRSCTKTSSDLETDGPLHAELMRIAENDHVLLLVIHAHVIDDFSSRLLTRELLIAYDHYVHYQDPLLPSAMRYSDYVLEEVQREGKLSDLQIQYWRSVVSGSRDPIPRQESYSAGSVVRFRFLASSITLIETDRLRQFASAINVSMAVVLYAVIFLAVSSQYSADDIIATVPYSGRDSRALETLSAKTVRLIPLRVDMNSRVTLAEFARKTQTTFMQGAIASRAPLFTSPHAVAQLLGELRSAENIEQGKESVQQRSRLIIVDHLYVQRKLELATPRLSAERVILDPRAYDSLEIDLEALRASPFGDGPLFITLRRDLAMETGRPVTFVGGFYTHALSESEVTRLLERICDIARMTHLENQHVPIGELIFRVPNRRRN